MSPRRSSKSTKKSKSRKSQKSGPDKRLSINGRDFAVFRPHEDPAFFSIFVEKQDADHLANKDLDDESRMLVIYHILKD
jgi:hypothetical protein